MSHSSKTQQAEMRLAILALVGGFEGKESLSIGQIKEMLATQGFDERLVHQKALALLVTGALKLNSGLKISLGNIPWEKEALRADIDWAVRRVDYADREVAAAHTRRAEAIATLVAMSRRDFH